MYIVDVVIISANSKRYTAKRQHTATHCNTLLLLSGVDAFFVYICIHVSIYVYIFKYWGRYFLYVHMFSDVSSCVYIHKHIHIYIHMYIYIYMSKRESLSRLVFALESTIGVQE